MNISKQDESISDSYVPKVIFFKKISSVVVNNFAVEE